MASGHHQTLSLLERLSSYIDSAQSSTLRNHLLTAGQKQREREGGREQGEKGRERRNKREVVRETGGREEQGREQGRHFPFHYGNQLFPYRICQISCGSSKPCSRSEGQKKTGPWKSTQKYPRCQLYCGSILSSLKTRSKVIWDQLSCPLCTADHTQISQAETCPCQVSVGGPTAPHIWFTLAEHRFCGYACVRCRTSDCNL